MIQSSWRVFIGLLALMAIGIFAVQPVAAEPPSGGYSIPFSADGAGYTLHYWFNNDPKSEQDTSAFQPDVKAIYAWAVVSADNGATAKQFQLDTQFVSPNGNQVQTKWYGPDT